MDELEARPKAVARAKAFVATASAEVGMWHESKPWINATKRDELAGKVTELGEWVEAKEEEQGELPLTAAPAETSQEVMKKVAPIEASYQRLSKTPKPKPPKEDKKPKKNATNVNATDANATVVNATDTDATDA